ncbi:MAG: fatty-acid--CoA ligase [Betaproteobacteria bacterium]|nr:fatty-acid--CoA ligase [Betaproteobacteria bacterium]
MKGQMQQRPLLISSLIEHASRNFGDTEIISRTVEGPIHRYNYREANRRAKRLANALKHLGVQAGDRVATVAWNGYRHFETYYAVSGMGAVMHTVNPRLFPEQLAYIFNHAADAYVFFDHCFFPLIESLADKLPKVKAFVAMTDRAHMPPAKIPKLLCYEDLLTDEADDFVWPVFDDETASSLCYTSGTTGNPKGVLYSHRSTVYHTYAATCADAFGITSRDAVLPVVPMFHVNAWGLPYICAAVGAKIVFPGAALDGASLYQLFEQEKVTLSAGVPTVWMGLLQYVKSNGLKFSSFRETVIGGSACPPAMIASFENDYGVNVVHAWGMSELSPLGSMCRLREKHLQLTQAQQMAVKSKQGAAIFGVEMKIVDAEGKALPHDGKAFGDLMVRGPWVVERYFGEDQSALVDGWFATGDVSTIDADGYMQITDRSKDVIKSGGEWISSIDLECVAMAHPAVAEAAVIGVAHPKWDERPLLVVVLKKDAKVTREELLQFFQGKIAKWWTPDDVTFVEQLPHTATGKLLKTKLREDFKGYRLPGAKT